MFSVVDSIAYPVKKIIIKSFQRCLHIPYVIAENEYCGVKVIML